MNFEVLIKYLIWISFAVLAIGGIYFLSRKVFYKLNYSIIAFILLIPEEEDSSFLILNFPISEVFFT